MKKIFSSSYSLFAASIASSKEQHTVTPSGAKVLSLVSTILRRFGRGFWLGKEWVITNTNFDFITIIEFQSNGKNGSGAGGLWASGTGGASVYNEYGTGGGHTYSGGNAFLSLTYLGLRK